MKLHICASVPAATESKPLCTEFLVRSDDLGLSGVELKLGENDLLSSEMRGWLADVLPSYDLEILTHLPYLQGEVNIASPDEARGRRAVETIVRSLRFSRRLGCTMVNTHLGAGTGEDQPILRATQRLLGIERTAGDLGIEICVENQESSCGGILNTPEDLRALLALHPGVWITYDPGHGNTFGRGVDEFLPVVMPRLRYLHLHDNDGVRDQHRALGEGNVDFPKLLATLFRRRAQLPEKIPTVLELRVDDLARSCRYLEKHAQMGLLVHGGGHNGRS